MPLADLIGTLRADLADPTGERFTDEVLRRCILKSAFPVGRDTGVQMTVSAGEIVPEPEGELLELLLLHAQVEACRFMRAATASAFSFSSGDKKVDKTGQPEQWAKLEGNLMAEYRQRLHDMEPEGSAEEDYIITPRALRPVIYEQGVDVVDTTTLIG